MMTPQEQTAAALVRKWGDAGIYIRFSQVEDIKQALLDERERTIKELKNDSSRA